MTRILVITTWIVCLTWAMSTLAEAAPGAAQERSFQLAPGAWARAMERAPRAGQLRPGFRHLRLQDRGTAPTRSASVGSDAKVSDAAIEKLGVLRQSQTAPPPPGGFLAPGSPTFYLFIIDMTMLVGSLVVQIGSNIAAGMDADLTGWKVAGLVIDGIGLATAIGMLATIDMSQFPMFFTVIIGISLALSGLSFIWGGVKLVMYINRRNKLKEMRERERNQPDGAKPAGPKKGPPVVVLPWGGVDPDGNPMGGLAMVGRF